MSIHPYYYFHLPLSSGVPSWEHAKAITDISNDQAFGKVIFAWQCLYFQASVSEKEALKSALVNFSAVSFQDVQDLVSILEKKLRLFLGKLITQVQVAAAVQYSTLVEASLTLVSTVEAFASPPADSCSAAKYMKEHFTGKSLPKVLSAGVVVRPNKGASRFVLADETRRWVGVGHGVGSRWG